VGDRMTDILPARQLAGRGILVRTGHGAEHAQAAIDAGFTVAADLQTAAAGGAGDIATVGRGSECPSER